jgi:hypothetical protein
MIESMVAVLLLLTILYCVRLSKQLRLMRADEQSLRATIAELVTATEIAERAIAGLKSTMRDGEQTLGVQIAGAEQLSVDLGEQLAAGEDLLGKLARIAGVVRPSSVGAAAAAVASRTIDKTTGNGATPDAKSVAAAAQAFAERAKARLEARVAGNIAA